MFCSKCGTKLSDDALFCMKCGNKVSVFSDNEQNTYLASQQSTSDIESKVNADGNANVSKNFDNLTIKNVFSERVNSEIFDNRTSQNKLFSLYSSLIPSVKKIERDTSNITEMEEQIKGLRDKTKVPYGRGPKIIKGIFVFVLIFQFFDNPVANFFNAIATFFMNPMVEVIEDWFFLFRLIGTFFISFIVGIFITPLLIAMICGSIWLIYYKVSGFKKIYSKRLAEAEELEKKYQERVKDREATCLSIAEGLKYVPRKYRTSQALTYFVETYNNSRVDTLKEAVNMYVTDTQAQKQLELTKELTKVSVAILWNIEELVAIQGGGAFDVNLDLLK